MNISTIAPFSGDHFEDFMILTNQEHKTAKKKQAWQVLRQQIQSHVPDIKKIDLNRIFVDAVRMELLIFPVVEHWKRPLTNAEWDHIDRESRHLENQMEKMKKLSALLRKKDPRAFPEIAPLFNRIFDHNRELRNSWAEFKKLWTNYKKEWELFQIRKKQALKNRQKSKKSKQNTTELNNSATEIEPPESPPMFSRERWHALRVSSKALEVEILRQCERFRGGKSHEQENSQDDTHPGVKFLVDQLRKIYLKTHGFELIERVKLVQKRNDQLMRELQPYFPEPIISEEMKTQTKPATKHRNSSAAKIRKQKSASARRLRKIIVFAMLSVLGALIFFLSQNQGLHQEKDIIKHLKFVPKEKTITAKSPAPNDLSDISMEDMLQGFQSDIPLMESNEYLKKMITAPPEILDNIANSILQEIGKNAVFVFSEAKSLFLFWKGSLEKFVSVDDLNKKLQQLENKYSEVKSLWKEMGENAPENVRVIPDMLDGEATYALEMLDEKGLPMQVYMTEDGVVMRLSNGELLDKPLTPDQAARKISQF
jgi:hypothetical protein